MDDKAIFAEGWKAFQDAEYEHCLSLIRPLAENGFPPAQGLMGSLYDLGLGVTEDASQAFRWYKEASDGGDGVASNNLGTLYYGGRGVKQDEKEARRLYKKAHEQGFIHAPPGE